MMKRLLMLTSAVVASLAATSLVVSAGPIFENGGPMPDPKALSHCAGEQELTISTGGGLYSAASPRSDGGDRDTPRPIMMDGGPMPWPVPSSAAADPAWCAGAYRPDAGTNFGGGF